jgi:hypothetical protein
LYIFQLAAISFLRGMESFPEKPWRLCALAFAILGGCKRL